MQLFPNTLESVALYAFNSNIANLFIYYQSCFFKKIGQAGLYVAKLVGWHPSWHNNYVVVALKTWRNVHYNAFHLPAQLVALHCTPVFFADGKTYFALLNFAFAVQQYKKLVGYLVRMLVDVVVLIVFFQSVNCLQIYSPLLSRKLMTTLVSSSCKYSSATCRLHSCSESVYLASLSLFGLVISFHFLFLLLKCVVSHYTFLC